MMRTVFPAQAGMNRPIDAYLDEIVSVPRAGGDEPPPSKAF